MIALSLEVLADVVGGTIADGAGAGDTGSDIVVTGPVVIDGREAGPGSLFVAFTGEHTDGHEHAPQAAANGAVAVLGTRPTVLPTVLVNDPRAALQRLASYVVEHVRQMEGSDLTVVAVTGSQGKTSTKDLLAAVLGTVGPTVATFGSFNNEIGMPLTALRVTPQTRYLVLEMGARGRGHITELTDLVAPDIAVVLNVGSAHLGEFGSRDAIAQAKGELVAALGGSGIAVLNADDPRVSAMAELAPGGVVRFGSTAPAEIGVREVTLDRLGRPSFRLVCELATEHGEAQVRLQVVGAHQALNAAAAAAAGIAAGMSLQQVAGALSQVESLSKWRMELHELSGGGVLLNDAYNANPESTRAAIDALASIGEDATIGRTVAVLGEMRELGPESEEAHREVGRYAAARVDVVLVVGDAARAVHEGTQEAGGRSVVVADNAEAIAWLREQVRDGDAVLVKASRGARLDEVAAALQ